jgi:hypothetical protein
MLAWLIAVGEEVTLEPRVAVVSAVRLDPPKPV